MNTIITRDNKNAKIGDRVEFKYDYEGSGTIVEIKTRRDRINGIKTIVIVDVGDYGHHGHDYYDHTHNCRAMQFDPRDLWSA